MAAPPPRTRFAKNGDVNIAYQVVGEGDFDLVYVPGWVSHVEEVWREPRFSAGLRRLAAFSRLILIDRSGTGLSDPVEHLPTLEERAAEVRAVMDAVGSERASLTGVSEGGPMCAFFAASHPERTRSLVLLNTYARLHWSEETPWGISDEQHRAFIAQIEESWGDGDSARLFAPSLKRDEAFRESWGRMERYAVSPGTARRLLDMAAKLDVRDVLSSIQVPTLVLHRSGDRATPVEGGRFLASRIPGAKLVEVPGIDHFPFVGDTEPVFQELERFLTGTHRAAEPDRVLATVLFTDIVDSTRRIAELGDRAWGETLERFYALVRDEVGRFRGCEVDTAGDGYLASFDGPARAIRCAQAVREGVRSLGLSVRQGVHTGECELIGGKPGGLSVHIGARVAAKAEPGEILVSRTVRDLVVGSSLHFEDRGDGHELKGVPGAWQLFAAA
jgi:pimeloyl-ACP methyl ester carboxylesterase/class 3 adenylate cyclase